VYTEAAQQVKFLHTNAYKGGTQLEHRMSWLDLLLDISDKQEDSI
jgi:hypothetical protein